MSETENTRTESEAIAESETQPSDPALEAQEIAAEQDAGSAEDDWKARYEEMNDKYLRVLAETENFKKRMQRDRADEKAFAAQGAVMAVLPVVDNLERAVDATQKQLEGKETDPLLKQLFEGVELTLKQFDSALQKLEVERIECEVGKPFDPNLHQALFQEENAELDEGSVLEIMQPGYRLAGRVIRPSLVKVSRKP